MSGGAELERRLAEHKAKMEANALHLSKCKARALKEKNYNQAVLAKEQARKEEYNRTHFSQNNQGG